MAEKQRAKGMATYGYGVEMNPADAVTRIEYLQEELIDALMYCEWIKESIKAEREKIVHCKECKHWADGVNGCTDHVKCCKIGFYMVGENGYCVYGERKNDEQGTG